MSRKTQSGKQSMSAVQKQAVLVCVICALATLLTLSITLNLLKKKAEEETPASSEQTTTDDTTAMGEDLSAHYQIDKTSAALLTETEDAGTEYLTDTLFLGDSNTVRLYNNGLISLQQFCAKEGIGTRAALNEAFVAFKGTSELYTIPQAVAMMKPRRVVMTFGTNDAGMTVSNFIANYTALIQAIQSSYPYTDIIVNSAEALKGEDGYGNANYYTSGDIHLKTGGLKAMLSYLRTHAYETEDRRPDTSGISTRTLEYTSKPSPAVAGSSSSESTSESESSSISESESESESTSESEEQTVQYEARYKVDKSGGGTLNCGNKSGETSLSVEVTEADQSVSVTAVPEEGYVFVKWSDGKTTKTRTDTDFQQNLEVTAVFSAVSVKITGEGKGTLGSTYTFHASLSGKYASSKNLHWYANGVEVTAAKGYQTVLVTVEKSLFDVTYEIYAVLTYNDCSVKSNTLKLTFVGDSGSSSSGSSSSGASGSSASSTASSDSGTSSGSTSQSEAPASSASSESSSASESASQSTSEAPSSTSEASSSTSTASSSPASVSSSESSSGSGTEEPASSGSEAPASSTSSASSEAQSSTEPQASTETGTG